MQNDHQQVHRLYLQHADMLYRIAMGHLQNSLDAEDVLQDVFEKYLTLPLKPTNEQHAKAWLIRATVNRCHDHFRKAKVRKSEPLDAAAHVEDSNRFSEELHAVMQKLAVLPQKSVDVVILHCLEGFTLPETAQLLKISLSAAKMRLQRARESLAEMLKEDEHVQ